MVKTITVTEEAYKNLKRMKLKKESFSDVINRIGSSTGNINSLVGIMKNMDINETRRKIKEFKREFTEDMEKRRDVLAR